MRHIGLSEVGAETIRRAAAVHPICDLQIEYSLISRGIEERDPPHGRELGIGDHRLRRALARPDQRPLGAEPAAERPATSAPCARASRARTSSATWRWWSAARARGASGRHASAQLAIAWVLARRGHRPPDRRTTRERLDEAMGALELRLSDDDLAQIEDAVPADAAAGARYPEMQMAHLDSER